MKYIDEQTQAQLDMNEVILEVEKAFASFFRDKTITPLRYVLPFNEQNRYLVMPALSDELNIVGLKTVSFAPENSKRKATITGSVILSDYETGETLSILDGGFLTKVRTGAISGVATKYLAKENAKTLSVIGAGVQAEGLLKRYLLLEILKNSHRK